MSAKDHPLQTSGLKTDGLEGQGARHRYPCDDARSFTGGIVHPRSAEPTAAQPRDFVAVLGRFEFAEPINLRSQARRYFRLWLQRRT